jgi:hypothetical protein
VLKAQAAVIEAMASSLITPDEAATSHQAEHPDILKDNRLIVVSTGIYRAPGSAGAAA